MLIIPNCFIEGVSARTRVFPRVLDGDDPYGAEPAANAYPASGSKTYFCGADENGAADTNAKYGQMYTYDAATFNAAGDMVSANNGPLGNLDRPVGGLGSITAGIVVRKMD